MTPSTVDGGGAVTDGQLEPELVLRIAASRLGNRVTALQGMLATEARRADENGQPDRAWLLEEARKALAEQQHRMAKCAFCRPRPECAACTGSVGLLGCACGRGEVRR